MCLVEDVAEAAELATRRFAEMIAAKTMSPLRDVSADMSAMYLPDQDKALITHRWRLISVRITACLSSRHCFLPSTIRQRNLLLCTPMGHVAETQVLGDGVFI